MVMVVIPLITVIAYRLGHANTIPTPRLSSALWSAILASSQRGDDNSTTGIGINVTFKPTEANENNFTDTAVGLITNLTSTAVNAEFEKGVTLVSEAVVYAGYRNMLHRGVRFPTGKQVVYDIVDQRHPSIVVFAWDSRTCTATLIREYHPGVNKWMYGTVAGMYEPSKHSTPLEAAMFELEEEAHLRSDIWIPLLEDVDVSVPFDKYSSNMFYPFLAVDCTGVDNPRPMDDEEFIAVEHLVPHHRLQRLMSTGELNVLSSYTILGAISKLRQLGYRIDNNDDRATASDSSAMNKPQH